MQAKTKESKRGGKRPGSGRKKGQPNNVTKPIKELAAVYSVEVINTLGELMRNGESESIKLGACKELLDRAHGRPAVCGEIEVSGIPKINWEEMRKISEAACKQADEEYDKIIKGRAERLGIKLPYTNSGD